MNDNYCDFKCTRNHACPATVEELLGAAQTEGYKRGYADGGKPAYDLAHDILADKRLPRQEAIDEFTRKTKCHLCGGWGFHENSCPHWPRGDNSHNAEQAVDEKLMRFVGYTKGC